MIGKRRMRRMRTLTIFILCLLVFTSVEAKEWWPTERDFTLGKEGVLFFFREKDGKCQPWYRILDSKVEHRLGRPNDHFAARGPLNFQYYNNQPTLEVLQIIDVGDHQERALVRLNFRYQVKIIKNLSESEIIKGTPSSEQGILGWRDEEHFLSYQYVPSVIQSQFPSENLIIFLVTEKSGAKEKIATIYATKRGFSLFYLPPPSVKHK